MREPQAILLFRAGSRTKKPIDFSGTSLKFIFKTSFSVPEEIGVRSKRLNNSILSII